MVQKEFFKPIPFINRVKEQRYLKDYLTQVPRAIQFIYGPKSTGKTALITKVIKELPKDKYAIQYIDMRGVLIKNFEDFKNIFFPDSIKGKIKEIVSGIKFNFGIFGWDIEDEKMIKENIFGVMEQKLQKANEKGIRRVIIIDEFQYLKDIIIDEKNNLLLVEELWKFFIRLTKVTHLAYVICSTSDSYYIEELYAHTKLKNTSKYYLVDHLQKEDIVGWLKDEGLTDEVIEYFWENLGGSVWEIWQALLDYKNTGDYKGPIQTMIDDEYAKIYDLIRFKEIFTKEEKEIFKKISSFIAKNGEYIIGDEDDINFEIIKKTVDLDIWFYDSRKQKITANSQTVRKAFERF